MKKLSLLLVGLLAIATCTTVMAQYRGFVSFGWKLGQALEETEDFIDEPSLEGVHFGLEGFVTTNFSMGVDISYSHFYQETGKTSYEFGNRTFTGAGFKYFDAAPMLFTMKQYVGLGNPRSVFSPYIGIGGGTYFIRERLEIGSVAFEDDGWVLGYAPLFGFMIRMDEQAWFFVDAAYNRTFERNEIEEHTFVTGTVGIRIGF